jgi:hypothetical protein
MQGTGAEREMGLSTGGRDGEVEGTQRGDNFGRFWKRREEETSGEDNRAGRDKD